MAVKAKHYFLSAMWLIAPVSFGLALLLNRLAVDKKWVQDVEWMQRMKDCVDMVQSAEYLNHRHFLHTGITAAAFGSVAGQLVEW